MPSKACLKFAGQTAITYSASSMPPAFRVCGITKHASREYDFAWIRYPIRRDRNERIGRAEVQYCAAREECSEQNAENCATAQRKTSAIVIPNAAKRRSGIQG
jgi:hypothetical protein